MAGLILDLDSDFVEELERDSVKVGSEVEAELLVEGVEVVASHSFFD